MKRSSLYFTSPLEVAIGEEPLPEPAPDQVLVQTAVSAISPGTEMLIFRGEMPAGMTADATIGALAGELAYPLKYGYAAVGRVIGAGSAVDQEWRERMGVPGQFVFGFNPHETHFLAAPAELQPVPQEMSPETAAFLPNMETAVSFLMDAQPMIGEQVVVFGQGVVGLLTTMLLAQYPLAGLITLDRHPLRRAWSQRLGADVSLDPTVPDTLAQLRDYLGEQGPGDGADLVLELSGSPQALDQAIAVTGYNGRILIGSWYGEKRADLNLGGRFHRSHMQLISSQVSRIAPRWRGRWDKGRRLRTAWAMLAQHAPMSLVTHRFPISDAAGAYRVLHERPQDAIQILLTYD
ncbi:MAG: zinc-binding dehydrogenase [Anaerolineae bacterium]